MQKLRTWLLERFLPAWAKDSVYQENRKLLAQLERRDRELRELNAYVDGLETGLRSLRRIAITNEVTHEHLERAE